MTDVIPSDLPDVHKVAERITNNNKTKEPLNVMIFYPDDWRHDSLGCAGNPTVKTPFFDRLASEGIRFSNNCVTTSICWISRATLMTGQYLSRHKSQKLAFPIFYDSWNTTWPAVLQQNGYFVGHIGKWQYHNYSFVQEKFNWTALHEGRHEYVVKGKKVRAAARVRDEALQFLKERPKDRPFALTMAFYPPKAIGQSSEPGAQFDATDPYLEYYENITIPEPLGYTNDTSYAKLPPFLKGDTVARRSWKQRYATPVQYQASMKNYYALITEVDRASEQIFDELKKENLLENTVLIFTTDNGFFHAEHGLAGKWYPFQESIRVPLILRDPRIPTSRRGTVDNSFTLNIDLAETILGAANVDPPDTMQGRDIADLYMKSSPGWREDFFYEHHSMGKKSITSSSALVQKDFKYFLWPEWNNYEQLFNITNDPLEQQDLAKEPEYAELLSKMRTRHNELREQAK